MAIGSTERRLMAPRTYEHPVCTLCSQPLSLRNYPYEAYSMEQQLTLTDTSRLVAGHPGLELVPSAVSVEVRCACALCSYWRLGSCA